jgi:prephenate dehydrogenase
VHGNFPSGKGDAGEDEHEAPVKRPTVGLIGYGRFGKLAAHYISRHANVLVYDPARTHIRSTGNRIRAASTADAAGQNIVILAVPVSSLRNVLQVIRPHVKPGALVLDVCAVKVKPVEWMKRQLPGNVHILGTHPLFGPDSAALSLKGHAIVLCPVRCPEGRVRQASRILRKAGLKVVRMTPAQHDRLVAVPLFIAQYLGRVASRMAPPVTTATASSRRLSEVAGMAENDSMEMFRDLFRFNSFARKTPVGMMNVIEEMGNLLRRNIRTRIRSG